MCVCLSVYLSLAAFPYYCTDPDVTWKNGRGCPLVVHYWPDLQSAGCTGHPYHSPKLHPGPCSNMGMRRRTDTHRGKQTRVTNIHFESSTTHAKCNNLDTFYVYVLCTMNDVAIITEQYTIRKHFVTSLLRAGNEVCVIDVLSWL